MSSTLDRSSIDSLVREREFLLRSIEDLEKEHAAGDVGDEDYRVLRDDYVARAAATVRALADRQGDPLPGASDVSRPPRPIRLLLGRRRTRRALVGIGAVCVLGVVAVAAASVAGVRFPGESATGTVSLPKATQIRDDLSEATLLAGSGNQAEAVALYGEVLTLDPRQPVALAYRGWLVRLAGRSSGSNKAINFGDESIARAVAVAPRFADARAFFAIALFEDRHETAAALGEIRSFLADHPSTGLLAAVGHELAAIDEAGRVGLPAALAPFARSGT